MATVTAPIMTDATGQSIDSKLNSLLGKMDNLAAAFQPNASGIVYSNTTSGLIGDDVQEAIDEMAADVSEIKQSLSQKMSGTFTLLANLTTIDTEYTLNDDVTNYKYIVALLYYGDFVLTTTDIPIDLWNTTTKVIVNYNDGTIRKGQFTISSNTKVHTALSSAGWSNISGVKLYGVK